VSGEFAGEGLPEWVTDFLAVSLSEFYRYTYARAAAVESVAPADVQTESTLPRVRVGASAETVPEGGSVGLTVRVLHPVTGRFVGEESPDTRFDLDSSIVLRLRHDAGVAEDIILVANLAEPGVYRASAAIPATGTWSAQATITGPDGQSWALDAAQLLEGVPSWEATDGRRYFLRVETDPAEPTAGVEAAVTARFVDIETGTPMPVTAEPLDDFGDDLRVLFSSDTLGALTVILRRTEQGIFEGATTFRSAGVWEATLDITREGDDNLRIGAGTVTVVQ
jgi:hypothetical protein